VTLRVCTVSSKSPTGLTHGVDVEAQTLYEAVVGFGSSQEAWLD